MTSRVEQPNGELMEMLSTKRGNQNFILVTRNPSFLPNGPALCQPRQRPEKSFHR